MSPRACALPVLSLLLTIMVGCGGEPPEKEMQQAEGALAAAQAAGADRYATDEFAAAQASLSNAREAVTQRDYRLALDRALDSRERAQNAAKQAADGKAVARSEADRALAAAQAALDAVAAKIDAADAAKTPARVLAGPKDTLDTARTALQEARALFDRGEYLEVASKARAATASLPAVTEAIDAAVSAPPRRRR
ncbi:MAG: hypothetical protein AB7H96_06105 [Vicinamibacterales bacterium]